MSEELKQVSQLCRDHIGQWVRVQTLNGAFVEGTLTKVEHFEVDRDGRHVFSTVYFREFDQQVGKDMESLAIQTVGNRVARLVEETGV